MEELGPEKLYEELRQQDPQYAATITKFVKQKIVRALEIMTISGKKVSKLGWKTKKNPQTYDFRCWFLYREKPSIYQRIDQRCDMMLEQGFLEETVRLLEQGDILLNSSAAQAIGYRQAIDYLRSPQTPADYEKFVKDFKQASRNYAKRQYTWFRRESLFRWVDMDLVPPDTLMKMIQEDYDQL
jgi:tRNA dimethylallyltransferase